MNSEDQARFAEIIDGPARVKSQFARQEYRALSPPALAAALRPHAKLSLQTGDTIRGFDLEFRTSFDFVLEELQLIEIAVACGYLPLDLVRAHVSSEFAALIASEPARQYLKFYDFVCVRYLAARVGIDLGLVALHPPEVRPTATVRYAMFLSTYFRFVQDGGIETFTQMLDDIHWGRASALFLAKHLSFSNPELKVEEQTRAQAGYIGYVTFVEYLGDFFATLPKDELGHFGLAFGYWLSHFFGLTRRPGGYTEDRINFVSVGFPKQFPASEFTEGEYEGEVRRFDERVRILKDAWERTRQTIENAGLG